MTSKKPELLAPAGSYDALVAAIKGGCNAVYLGGSKFGARAFAGNFTNDELLKALELAHLNDVSIYYTANTLIKESEISDFIKEVEMLYTEGIDALILQDLGAYQLVHKYFPKLPLHASTQMTIHGSLGAKFIESLGFERVVLSRELSLKEIERVKEITSIELECFVHGALCYSYSGQCLFSSIIGGRSGNRGRCAQPCRLPYQLNRHNKPLNNKNENYLLSPKDIMTLEILPQLIEAGISSFKIEGRMKNPGYVGLVTSVYRKYIDLYCSTPNNYRVSKNDLDNLTQIYNRGGFSQGYYFMNNGREMMSLKRPNHAGKKIGKVDKIISKHSIVVGLNEPIHKGDCIEIETITNDNYTFIARDDINNNSYRLKIDNKKIKPNGLICKLTDVKLAENIQREIIDKNKPIVFHCNFTAKVGMKSVIELAYKDYRVTIEGNIIEQAKTSAITQEKMIKQLCKTGNYPIEIKVAQLIMDHDIFMPISQINAIRRMAIEAMLEKINNSYKRNPIKVSYNREKNVKNLVNTYLNVLLRNYYQFEIIKRYNVDIVYIDITRLSIKEINKILLECIDKKIDGYIVLPRIVRDSKANVIESKLKGIKTHYKGILAGTIDAYNMAKRFTNHIALDYTINIFNNNAIDFWTNPNIDTNTKDIQSITISPELNKKEISLLDNALLEACLYGHIPLMITSQCLTKSTSKTCTAGCNDMILKDRKSVEFKVQSNCGLCQNIIYNAYPLLLLDQYRIFKNMGIKKFRIDLLDESEETISRLMHEAIKIKSNDDINQEDLNNIEALNQFTRGHFNRGIK